MAKTKEEKTASKFREMLRQELDEGSTVRPHIIFLAGMIRMLVDMPLTDEHLEKSTQNVIYVREKDGWVLTENFLETGEYSQPAELRYPGPKGYLMAQTMDTHKQRWAFGQYIEKGFNVIVKKDGFEVK